MAEWMTASMPSSSGRVFHGEAQVLSAMVKTPRSRASSRASTSRATAVTAGTTPVEITQSEMVGDQYPHIAKDSVIHIDIDNGSNCVDLVIVCTFTEG